MDGRFEGLGREIEMVEREVRGLKGLGWKMGMGMGVVVGRGMRFEIRWRWDWIGRVRGLGLR